MNGFDDEDIARAIAASLQDNSGPSKPLQHHRSQPVEVITIDSDDDDDVDEGAQDDDEAQFRADLQRVMELSKSEAGTGPSSIASSSRPNSIPPPPTPVTPQLYQPPSNSLLFDRKKMEEERLARQKRLRPDLQHPVSGGDDEAEEGDEEEGDEMEKERDQRAKRQRLSSTLPSTSRANITSSSSSVRPAAGSSSSRSRPRPEEELFWEGELRQTANMHVDKEKDTRPLFRLSEIIGPAKGRCRICDIICVCGGPVVDIQSIPNAYPGYLGRSGLERRLGHATVKEILPEWIRTTPSLPGGRGCMHMKFMLLFYKTGRLRVVVSTANLIHYDWKDIENTVWVQDFPLRSSPIPHDSKATDFPATLTRILRSVNVVPALLSMVKNDHDDLPITRIEDVRCKWDFSKAKVYLIPSFAGRHEGWPKVIQTGHPSLMKAVREMSARAGKGQELTLECQGSSIGAYTTQWMNEFFCSAKGESAETWLDLPKARRTKLPYPPIKILFPSAKTVKESVLGEKGGGTMFCRRQQWEAAKFPRDHFYDSNSRRGRVLMHSKMIIGLFKDSALASTSSRAKSQKRPIAVDDNDSDFDEDIVEVDPHPREDVIGWAYVGSHNFTPSAWGNLNGSGFNPVMNITNFELGIAFPLKSERELEDVACYRRPPRKYVAGTDLPWIQSESPFFLA
ncbi:hypothetical protein EIP91_009535 [Steccherinum ochraceum]|uniref:Tyrosyl-DNA phosphodiesterase 1 n=1 Tax=Steccherinum ochraceum TaxID=92696 RepID=A0A4R0R3S3_9APHY|nr:hypothetical protein EIP91_009535 [Steccherinum ochraceum]